MCVTCGCSDGATVGITHLPAAAAQPTGVATATVSPDDRAHAPQEHTHILADGTVVRHSHPHPHEDTPAPDHAHEDTPTHAHASTSNPVRVTDPATVAAPELHARLHRTTVSLEQNLLAKNDLLAAQNRGWFKGRHILALNLVSSPGAGKTTLLTRTIQDLQSQVQFNVIEGDQATLHDAERIRQTGCAAVQINTGTGCHLEAAMVERGLQELDPPLHSIVMIENVGNLVCPALFDLGEQAKVVILSVTEGEDKPIKYPHMFRASQVMILTKTDLLPYVPFDVDRCLDYARQVNPHLQVFQVSATTGAGLENWYQWLLSQRG